MSTSVRRRLPRRGRQGCGPLRAPPPAAGGWREGESLDPSERPQTHSLAFVGREKQICHPCDGEGDRLTAVVTSDTRTRYRTLKRERK